MDIDLYGPDGQVRAAADQHGNILVAQGASPFDAAVERGNVYHACSQATVITQAGLSLTTPALVVSSLPDSGKVIKIWYAGCGSLVSAGAAAQIWACLGGPSDTIVVETAAAVVRNAKTGASGRPSGTWAGIDGNLPGVPVAVALLGSQSSAAITVGVNGFAVGTWFNGSLWVPPGFNFTIQSSTVTTLFCDYIFEVVDEV